MSDRERREIPVPDHRVHNPLVDFNRFFAKNLGVIIVAFSIASYVIFEVSRNNVLDRIRGTEADVVILQAGQAELFRRDSAMSEAVESARELQEADLRERCLVASEERLYTMAASGIPCGRLLRDIALPGARRQASEFDKAQATVPEPTPGTPP